jgi:hypothetical protein
MTCRVARSCKDHRGPSPVNAEVSCTWQTSGTVGVPGSGPISGRVPAQLGRPVVGKDEWSQDSQRKPVARPGGMKRAGLLWDFIHFS